MYLDTCSGMVACLLQIFLPYMWQSTFDFQHSFKIVILLGITMLSCVSVCIVIVDAKYL
jgi:hypothetical protein